MQQNCQEEKKSQDVKLLDLMINKKQLDQDVLQQVGKFKQGYSQTLELWDKVNNIIPRFTLFLYDTEIPQILQKHSCGCFIIPLGKENSFLFGTSEGNKELQKQQYIKLIFKQQRSQMSRLIVVRMNPGHEFTNLKNVQLELSPAMIQLTPINCNNRPCPFMTDGDELSEKNVLFQTDELIVEEVMGDEDYIFRRVVMKCNFDQTQSQCRLLKNQSEKVEQQKEEILTPIDHSYIDFQAHIAMVAGLVFLSDRLSNPEYNIEILILGGGTGSLSRFLTEHFKNITVTNIELSLDMILVAQSYFEFKDNSREKMINCDALDYVKQMKNSHAYDCIMIDINGKYFGQNYLIKASDINSISPPLTFLTQEFMLDLQSLLVSESGLVMLNLIDRFSKIKDLFWDVQYSLKCEDDLNEVYFLPNISFGRDTDGRMCVNQEIIQLLNGRIQNGVKEIDRIKVHQWDPILNIAEYITNIKLKQPKSEVQFIYFQTKQTKAFSINENSFLKDGQPSEIGQRKDFYQKDLAKVNKKKNNRKKVNKNR